MARPPRCLVTESLTGQIQLSKDDAHHLERVLRMADGATVELVDGRGGLALGRFVRGGRVSVEQIQPTAPPPSPRLVLAVAPPRAGRLDWLVEKAAELGVAELRLLDSEHAAREVGAGRLERLRRKAEAALLQCRRLHTLQLHEGQTLTVLLSEWDQGPVAYGALEGDVDAPRPAAGQGLLLLVGPEGGFSAPEQQLMDSHGVAAVRLGSGVLRVETAALALAVRAGIP